MWHHPRESEFGKPKGKNWNGQGTANKRIKLPSHPLCIWSFLLYQTINQASISISTFAYRIYCTPHGKFIRDLDNNMAKRKSLCTVGASTNTLFFHYVNIFHGHTILSLFLSLFLKVTSAPFQYLIASWNWFTHWFTLDWEVRKVRKNRCSFSMKSIHDALHSATERV